MKKNKIEYRDFIKIDLNNYESDFLRLNKNLKIMILTFLPLKEILKMEIISKEFHRVIQSSPLVISKIFFLIIFISKIVEITFGKRYGDQTRNFERR